MKNLYSFGIVVPAEELVFQKDEVTFILNNKMKVTLTKDSEGEWVAKLMSRDEDFDNLLFMIEK